MMNSGSLQQWQHILQNPIPHLSHSLPIPIVRTCRQRLPNTVCPCKMLYYPHYMLHPEDSFPPYQKWFTSEDLQRWRGGKLSDGDPIWYTWISCTRFKAGIINFPWWNSTVSLLGFSCLLVLMPLTFEHFPPGQHLCILQVYRLPPHPQHFFVLYHWHLCIGTMNTSQGLSWCKVCSSIFRSISQDKQDPFPTTDIKSSSANNFSHISITAQLLWARRVALTMSKDFNNSSTFILSFSTGIMQRISVGSPVNCGLSWVLSQRTLWQHNLQKKLVQTIMEKGRGHCPCE